MQVILLEKIKRVGDIGSIAEVNRGFGLFLIRMKKVLRATEDNLKKLDEKRALIIQEDIERKLRAEADSVKISNKSIVIERHAGEEGRLHGAITVNNILDKIRDSYGVVVEPLNIVLPEKIKSLGVYNIEVNLHADVKAIVHTHVVRVGQNIESLNIIDESLATEDIAK